MNHHQKKPGNCRQIFKYIHRLYHIYIYIFYYRYIHINIYIYIYVHTHIHIYIYSSSRSPVTHPLQGADHYGRFDLAAFHLLLAPLTLAQLQRAQCVQRPPVVEAEDGRCGGHWMPGR